MSDKAAMGDVHARLANDGSATDGGVCGGSIVGDLVRDLIEMLVL
jgi:hypothetical protein